MRKIMIISETIGGGLRKHLMLLLHNLNLDDYEIILVYGNRVDDAFIHEIPWLEQQGIRLVNLSCLVRSLDLKQDFAAYRQLKTLINEEQPDIVHCHSSKAGIVGRFAAKANGVKQIFYTPHGYSFQADEFSNLKKRLFCLIERSASHLATTMTFTVSNGEKELAVQERIDKPDKFEVIYNGLPKVQIPKGRLRDLLQLGTDDFIVGTCARISSEKNAPLFVKIAQSYIQQNPNAHFVWIGDGEDIESYRSIHPNIHFIGFRDDSDQLVADFNVFLTTSLHEGLPYSPIEAIRAGVPVVASDVVGNNEVVIEGLNGYLYPLNDVQRAVQAIHKAVNLDEDTIKQDFNKRFSLDNMMTKIEKYYVD